MKKTPKARRADNPQAEQAGAAQALAAAMLPHPAKPERETGASAS